MTYRLGTGKSLTFFWQCTRANCHKQMNFRMDLQTGFLTNDHLMKSRLTQELCLPLVGFTHSAKRIVLVGSVFHPGRGPGLQALSTLAFGISHVYLTYCVLTQISTVEQGQTSNRPMPSLWVTLYPRTLYLSRHTTRTAFQPGLAGSRL